MDKPDPNEIRKLPPLPRLLKVMEILRSPNGCPWDKEQDHESIADCVVEEAHELVEAILKKDDPHMIEELGDVLLQVVFHSQIATEEGRFNFDDVVESISEKLLVRHPHVFGEQVAENAENVKDLWERIKNKEKGKEDRGVLGGVAAGLPPLQKAEKIQKKAGKQGFDWDHWKGTLEKVQEEIEEFKQAKAKENSPEIEEELGDLLFTIVNLSRKVGVSPAVALEKSNQKFIRRFNAMESKINEDRSEMKKLTISEWESLWQAAKNRVG